MKPLLPHGVYKMPRGKQGKHLVRNESGVSVRKCTHPYVAKIHFKTQFFYLGRYATEGAAETAVKMFYQDRGLETPLRRALRPAKALMNKEGKSLANIHEAGIESGRPSGSTPVPLRPLPEAILQAADC